jgi:hypothetical protein
MRSFSSALLTGTIGHNLPIKSSGLSDWLKTESGPPEAFSDRQAPTRCSHLVKQAERLLPGRCTAANKG